MSKRIISKFAASAAIMGACFAGSAHAKSEAAAPFDIVIGGAGSCEQALAQVGETTKKDMGGDEFVYYAKDSTKLYPTAKKLVFRCDMDKVIALSMSIPKGGMGNPEARTTYNALAKMYKRVAGGPIPQVGNGYARFTKGSSVIELDAPHMSFEFELVYFEKELYDRIVELNKQDAAKKNAKKRAL